MKLRIKNTKGITKGPRPYIIVNSIGQAESNARTLREARGELKRIKKKYL